jgi:hypothetical protein
MESKCQWVATNRLKTMLTRPLTMLERKITRIFKENI